MLVTAGAGTCQWHGMPCAALNSGAVTRPTGGLACSVQLVSLPLCCATAGGSAPPSVQCNYMRTARRSGWLRLACKFHSSKAVNNASQNLSHLPVSLHPSQRPQAARTAAPAAAGGRGGGDARRTPLHHCCRALRIQGGCATLSHPQPRRPRSRRTHVSWCPTVLACTVQPLQLLQQRSKRSPNPLSLALHLLHFIALATPAQSAWEGLNRPLFRSFGC